MGHAYGGAAGGAVPGGVQEGVEGWVPWGLRGVCVCGVLCVHGVGMGEQEGGVDSQRGDHWRCGRFSIGMQVRLSQSICDMN